MSMRTLNAIPFALALVFLALGVGEVVRQRGEEDRKSVV